MSLEICGHQTEVKAHRQHLWMLYEESMCLPIGLHLRPYLLLVQPSCLDELNHPAAQWVLHLCTAVDFQMLLTCWQLHNHGCDVGLHCLLLSDDIQSMG